MSITIYENGSISIDGSDTGLGVSQGPNGTEVFTREAPGRKYHAHKMPTRRYQLGTDSERSKPGVATRSQFEKDIRSLLANL